MTTKKQIITTTTTPTSTEVLKSDNSYLSSLTIDNIKFDFNKEIFEYLESRDFHNYLNPLERNEEESIYPYIKDITIDKYQKGEDMIKTVSLLHNKTSYNKEINSTKYKKIHDNIIGHVNYLDKYYYEMLDQIELEEFPSPSDTIFLRSYSKLLSLFDFLKILTFIISQFRILLLD